MKNKEELNKTETGKAASTSAKAGTLTKEENQPLAKSKKKDETIIVAEKGKSVAQDSKKEKLFSKN